MPNTGLPRKLLVVGRVPRTAFRYLSKVVLSQRYRRFTQVEIGQHDSRPGRSLDAVRA